MPYHSLTADIHPYIFNLVFIFWLKILFTDLQHSILLSEMVQHDTIIVDGGITKTPDKQTDRRTEERTHKTDRILNIINEAANLCVLRSI